MTEDEFRFFGKTLAQIAVPELLLVAEHDGEPVGFCMTLPDINEALQPLAGRLTQYGLPIGLIRLLFRLKRVKTARLVALGVSPQYRRRGIAEMLILRTLDYGKNHLHYTGAELSWTLEDNSAINHAIEAVGGIRYKRYRLYEKQIG